MQTYDWMFPDFNRGEIEWDRDLDLSDEKTQLFVLEARPETSFFLLLSSLELSDTTIYEPLNTSPLWNRFAFL